VERTKPNGRIVGIDIIPAQPPKGVSTIQGNFLSKEVQAEIKQFLNDPHRGRPRQQLLVATSEDPDSQTPDAVIATGFGVDSPLEDAPTGNKGKKLKDDAGKTIDIVLSDMSAPWEQTSGFWKRSLSNPYRMMNTSGIPFRDHTGSMVRANLPSISCS
jgi:21S rRNA (uridine2791-2'-O)-methyltransferase